VILAGSKGAKDTPEFAASIQGREIRLDQAVWINLFLGSTVKFILSAAIAKKQPSKRTLSEDLLRLLNSP